MGWGQDYCVSSNFHGIKISHIPILKGICVFLFHKRRTHLFAEPSQCVCCMFRGEMFKEDIFHED